MNNRIEEIIQMLQDDPEDLFLLYVLALEYVKIGDDKKSEQSFDRLLTRFPDYLPTYYQAAHFFWEKGSIEKAKTAFCQGIEIAERTRDIKTEQELRNGYQNFLIDIDE